MLDVATQLATARSAQMIARQRFDTDLSQVRADIAAHGVGGRIADSVTHTAAGVMDEAIEVANENRMIVAGTVAALIAWILRRPLMRLASAVYDDVKERITE